MEIYLIALIILGALTFFNLVVGVSNDAVNFLNSSFGSRVASRQVIMIVASLGMLVGVTFSSGMMEVARKGLFNPSLLTMPDLMIIFFSVMLTNVFLLDFFNTFGLPTSTTVSIVFELLGAAVAVSLIKVVRLGDSVTALGRYINSATALVIIAGILLSVVVAFFFGAVSQFFSRLIFTFDYDKRVKRYGAVWGGIALVSIVYFILIKGAKGASFLTQGDLEWIKTHSMFIILVCFVVCAAVLQIMMAVFKVNILKVIILVGTFALALAFAANDLVNFIGVPLAGVAAYQTAAVADNPLGGAMTALQGTVKTNTLALLLAGMVMVVTLWFSKKAHTVMQTSLNLSRQEEGFEHFESSRLSRSIVRMGSSFADSIAKVLPQTWRRFVNTRIDPAAFLHLRERGEQETSFDLIRAAVNLMIASAVISVGTSLKLPLSTTYVTFMVAMGSSFADRAWDRDSAVYRISGVLTVIGGWFVTALMAFTISGIFAALIYFGGSLAALVLMVILAVLVIRNAKVFRSQENSARAIEVFNLKKIKDAHAAAQITFEHAGLFLEKVSHTLENSCDSLFRQDRKGLRVVRRHSKEIQNWSNIIIANIFKVLRLKDRGDIKTTRDYYNTIEALQEIAEAERDLVLRSYSHVSNNHKGLLDVQIDELDQIKHIMVDILNQSARALRDGRCGDLEKLRRAKEDLDHLMHRLDGVQISRIQNNSSKTRLSILFYAIIRDAEKMVGATLHLLDIFHDTLENGLNAEESGTQIS